MAKIIIVETVSPYKNISIALKPRIPKEPQLLCFGTKNFEQFRFQSVYVPIPKPWSTRLLEPPNQQYLVFLCLVWRFTIKLCN